MHQPTIATPRESSACQLFEAISGAGPRMLGPSMLGPRMRSIPFAIMMALFIQAFSYASAQARSSIPYVGCRSDGQLGPRRAPRREAIKSPLSVEVARQLAYYQAEQGSGVLAPRGWRCLGVYGSNGGSLFVVPQAIPSKLLLSNRWKGFSGPVVQISDSYGGTSGRFEVAWIIAQVFPAHRAFLSKATAEGAVAAGDFAGSSTLKDKLRHVSNEVVEYETPPHTEGLGTRYEIQSSESAIRGVEILVGPDEDPDLVSVSVRLPGRSNLLSRAIVEQSWRESAAKPRR